MSRPGALTPAELTAINGGGSLPTLGAIRFDNADDKMFAHFGYRMRILPTYGPYRTRAKQAVINPGVSPDNSEHCVIVSPSKGPVCAVDIDNQREFRNDDVGQFISILHSEGMYFHVAGEEWHCTIPNVTTAPAGGGTTPITEQEDDDMIPSIYLDPTTKSYRIVGPDIPDRPALDVRTNKVLDSQQVLAVNAYLLRQPPFYPGGKNGAAVFKDAATKQVIFGVLGWL